MILFDIKIITNLSFQLSAVATLGILTAQKFPFLESSNFFIQYVLETGYLSFIATLWTAPVQLHHFGALNVSSIMNNVAVGWLVPLITVSGFIIGIGGLAFFPLAQVLSFPLQLCAQLFLKLVNTLEEVPQVVIQGQLPVIAMWISLVFFLLLPGLIGFFSFQYSVQKPSRYLCS